MVTSGGGGEQEIEFRAKFNIDVAALQAQLKQVFGNIPSMMGQLQGQFGGGGNVNESGQVNAPSKEQDERSKVRTNALKHLAQQMPGGGLMSSMASAYKGGGLMAGMATGIGAAVGILTSIMKSSQIFQTLSGTVFKVLGFMADMFLMPFVPMMMKFVNWMLQHMPAIQNAGEKTVAILEGIASVLGWGARQQEAGKERGGLLGFGQRAIGSVSNAKTLGGAGLVAAGVGMTVASGGILSPVGAGLIMTGGTMAASGMSDSFQMGGRVPGSPGQGVPTMLHGGEMVIPQDIAAGAKGMGGRVAAWIERFQQKEMGPGGVINKWYDEMFGNSIIPKMWGDIRGLFQGIQGETEAVGRSVESTTGDIESDQKSFWSKLKFWDHIGKGWKLIKDCFNLIKDSLVDFFTFSLTLPKVPKIDWGGLGEKLGAVGDKLTGWGLKLVDFVVPDFIAPKLNFGALVGKLSDVGSALSSWMIDVVDFVIPDFPRFYFSWGAIWDCLKAVGSAIGGFFTGTIPNALVSAYNGVIGGVASAGRGLWNLSGTVITYLGYVGSAVKGFFTGTIPDKIFDAYDMITGWAPSLGGLGDSIKSALNSIGSAVRAAVGKLTAGISGIWSWTGLVFGRLSGSGSIAGRPRGGGGGQTSGPDIPTDTDTGTDTGTGTGTGTGIDTDDEGGDLGGLGSGVVVTTSTGEVTTRGEAARSGGGGWMPYVSSEEMDALQYNASTGPGAPAVYYESGQGTIERALSTNLGTIGKSGTYYASHAMTGTIASGIHSRGRAFGRLGRGGGGGGVAVANRTVNISINSNQSVADIVKDVERLQTLDEASFFNSVF